MVIGSFAMALDHGHCPWPPRIMFILPLIAIGIRKQWWPSVDQSPLNNFVLQDYAGFYEDEEEVLRVLMA